MLFTIFIALIVCEIVLALQFSKMARLITGRSSVNGGEVFGKSYRTVYQLYMDFHFLNELFDGRSITAVEDDQLKADLFKMRKILMAQIVGGLIFFFVGIALGLTK